MVAKAPPSELSLSEFLEGLFCVLAFREHRSVSVAPGVFEESLAQTLAEIEKQMKRERIRVAFRASPRALEQPGSALSKALRGLQKEGIIRIQAEPQPLAHLLLTPSAAYGRLSTMTAPIGFLERAAKVLHRRLQVGRIRRSLAGLASRGTTKND